MAKTEEKSTPADASGLDRLKEQVAAYATAQGQRMADKAGGKISDLAQGLGDVGDGNSTLLNVGKRVLGEGDSPVKAFLGEKTGEVKDKVVDTVKGAFGRGGKAGSVKVTNIVEVVDVGKPLRTVYDRWTQLEEFSSFTKGVQSVSQSDETESDWKAKIAFSSRSWKATVQEQIPDKRIVWNSEGAKGTTRGAVSFHELAPELTRVVAVVEYYPSGFFEKTGNIWRAQGRRLRLDLKHFLRYATLSDDEDLEGWRGEIRDGEVVRSHEEGLEADGRDDEDQDEKEQEDEKDQDEKEQDDEEQDDESEEGDADNGDDRYEDDEEDDEEDEDDEEYEDDEDR
ncbi:polyketide cyclase [Streptomyces ambofaciens]|uniref:Polyketide cyclase n=1 Tax=Streptomyces ambofaciens TaxID=1889 RepID=A0ABN4P784_STRAM|nr:SRPBCC family protein [Streptomyces ambofaciens]ANB07116.1 polyketide cyclase [Streptomyces ambofaciens]